jgi:hypothetical protein
MKKELTLDEKHAIGLLIEEFKATKNCQDVIYDITYKGEPYEIKIVKIIGERK